MFSQNKGPANYEPDYMRRTLRAHKKRLTESTRKGRIIPQERKYGFAKHKAFVRLLFRYVLIALLLSSLFYVGYIIAI